MKRNRAEGWKYAKISGHENENLIKNLIQKDSTIQEQITKFAQKEGQTLERIEVGGLNEKNVDSILNDSTKSKPDIKLTTSNKETINISIKKSVGGQVFLISPQRFINGYEKHYSPIPEQVKEAIRLYWGDHESCKNILDKYSKNFEAYEKKRNRPTKDTLDKVDNKICKGLLSWFQENISNIFDFCFSKGLAKKPEDWANIIWYKNCLGENDPNHMFSIDSLKAKISTPENIEKIQFGNRMGGSTIKLPFGFVQWHQKQMQFHHSLDSLKSI